jgi:hypothetical protein
MGKSGRGKAVYAPKLNAIWSSTQFFAPLNHALHAFCEDDRHGTRRAPGNELTRS